MHELGCWSCCLVICLGLFLASLECLDVGVDQSWLLLLLLKREDLLLVTNLDYKLGTLYFLFDSLHRRCLLTSEVIDLGWLYRKATSDGLASSW